MLSQNSKKPSSTVSVQEFPREIVREWAQYSYEIPYLYTVSSDNENLSNINTSSVHYCFDTAINILIEKELEFIGHVICASNKHNDRDEERNFVQIACMKNKGSFEKFFVGLHGDRLAIFDKSEPIACKNDQCMLRFANNPIEIKTIVKKLDLSCKSNENYPYPSIETLWDFVQNNQTYPSIDKEKDPIRAEINDLVQKFNNSKEIALFRKDVRHYLGLEDTIV